MKKIAAASFLYVAASITSAMPIGRTTIHQLLDQSPLVLKGTVVEVNEAAETSSPWTFNMQGTKTISATVECAYVLKGAAPLLPVKVLFPYISSDVPFVMPHEGATYLFFLAKDGATIKVVDPFNGAIPVLSGSEPESVADPVTLLKSEFEKSLASPDPSVVLQALLALSEVGDESSLEKVNQLSNSANESVRAAACAVTLALGAWDKAPEVVRFLNQRSQPSGGIILSEAEQGLDTGALMRLLGRTSAPEAESIYVDLLRETRNPYVLKELLVAPCITSSKVAAPAVAQFLDNTNDDVAYAAYRALMTMKGSAYKAQHLFVREKLSISPGLKSWSTSLEETNGAKP